MDFSTATPFIERELRHQPNASEMGRFTTCVTSDDFLGLSAACQRFHAADSARHSQPTTNLEMVPVRRKSDLPVFASHPSASQFGQSFV